MIFLCFIVVVLIVLLSAYQCIVRDMCPCTKTEKPEKPEGYEELGEEESEEEDIPLEEMDESEIAELAGKSLLVPTEHEEDENPHELPRSLSAYGDMQVDTGLKTDDNAVPVFGQVHFQLKFNPNVGRLLMTVVEAKEIPSKKRGGSSLCCMHLLLLPGRKQRFKTKSKGTPNPKINESFAFDRLIVQDLYRSAIRLRLYGHEKLGGKRLVGESMVQLADLAQSSGMKMDTWRYFRAKLPGPDSS